MIELLKGLDRALCAARAKADADQDRLLGVHQLVLGALSCEVPSVASFVTRAELALDVSVNPDDPETRLADLLCHLRHWANANGVDLDAAWNQADCHYQVERYDVHA